jgi:putative ABC transport system permease protein
MLTEAKTALMFKNFLKIAYRNILRHKSYAFINIMGLSIGLACTILIGIYVLNELSFDKFHSKSDRIYRIYLDGKMGTNKFLGPSTPAPMASALMADYPEVEEAARLFKEGNRSVKYLDKSFYEDNFFYADSNVFNIFTFEFIEGNKSALMQPKTLVITDKVAKKYFGTTNAVGKTIQVVNSDSTYFQITGVVKEFPSNSHFHFDFLASMSSFEYARNTQWVNNSFYTYMVLKPGTNHIAFQEKMVGMVKKYVGPQVSQYLHISFDELVKSGSTLSYKIQRLEDIHLHSNMDFELETNGNMSYVYIFIIIAFFTLLNACINFTNLSTARSAGRAKEVGLRKVFGGQRGALVFQFLSESVFISIIAVIIAAVLVKLALPEFNNLVGQQIDINTSQIILYSPILLLFAIITGIIAGSYPAFYLSGFVPAEVLKGKLNKGTGNAKLRSVLVVCQFTFSIFILLGTFIVARQLEFIQNKNMGFDKDKIVVIERTNPIRNNVKVFMEDLKSIPSIEAVSLSSDIPGRLMNHNGYLPEDSKTNEPLLFAVYAVDPNYTKTMGIEMKDGRFFSNDYPSDSSAIVINESAARYLAYKDPIGKRLINPGNENREMLTIIGVMKDFHFESLHKPVNPMVLFMNRDYYDGFITVRLAKGDPKNTLQAINESWKKFALDAPLQSFYFDQNFDKLYKSELQTRKLLSVFSVLTILIAVLGLFGLVSFMAERRTREIGLRKVLGSSVMRIVVLLSKDITYLVLLSSILAAVGIIFAANQWLQQFAYHIGISPWIIMAGVAISMVVAWLTICYQAIKAATKNPADSLRFE